MSDTQIYIYDHDYTGRINSNGEINQLWGERALQQSIKMWIASYEGDVIRNPIRGGYVTQWFLKPMQQVDDDDVIMSIRDGFEQDFTPYLELKRIEVRPNYEERYWEIYMEVYSSDLKVATVVDEKIRARV